jgi:cardiolipin synthase
MRTPEYLIYALALFMFASFTDLVDGWLARKLNQESEFGRFIDPIADKFLVIASLFAIITIDR